MIVPRITFDAKPVLRRLAKLPMRTAVVTAQELNRQRKQSKGRMTKQLAKTLDVKPQKRINRRIWFPRNTQATPRRLRADGLSLFNVAPARWFTKGTRGRGGGITIAQPGGTSEIQRKPVTGQPFRIVAKNGAKLTVRRSAVPNKGKRKDHRRDGQRTWLPVYETQIDISKPAYAVRFGVLSQLAREWPKVWGNRMKRELRRVFRA